MDKGGSWRSTAARAKLELSSEHHQAQTKELQLKAILNELTPQNLDRLIKQVMVVNIDNAGTLAGFVCQIYNKAIMEPTLCEMYASFCHHLAGLLPAFVEDNEKITFKRLLLNKFQEEFERREREQEEAERVEGDGEVNQSEEEIEEKRILSWRRNLGNIRLIGEIYKRRMLTERIIHECIKKLLGQYQNPDEEDIVALCVLMSTTGEMIDHPKAKKHMDAYFEMMEKLSNNMKLSSRVRLMLKDVIDLRKSKWLRNKKVERPEKFEELEGDAAQEQQAQACSLAPAPSICMNCCLQCVSVAEAFPDLKIKAQGQSELSSIEERIAQLKEELRELEEKKSVLLDAGRSEISEKCSHRASEFGDGNADLGCSNV